MDLDTAATVVQLAFYVIGATVAILTFRSATRGLLNTVNTEYQRRAMDRIQDLSEWLISEFDSSSDQFWANREGLSTYLRPIQNAFALHRDEIIASGKFHVGIPHNMQAERLRNMLARVRSDPFLPSRVRSIVLHHLERRGNVILQTHLEEIRRYCDELAQGHHGSDFDRDAGAVHNRINQRLYEEGCGVSQMEDEVHHVRLALQEYLESFDPFKRRVLASVRSHRWQLPPGRTDGD
jgi:hypothetical protein